MLLSRHSWRLASTDFCDLGRVLINRDCSAIAGCRKRRVRDAPDVQAAFCRRRHQPSRPPLARIRPGSPAPAIGPGTVTSETAEAVMLVLLKVKGVASDTKVAPGGATRELGSRSDTKV